jgi:hypothetical protein
MAKTLELTKEQYELLCDAYRKDPGNYAAAAKYAGVGVRSAQSAWDIGWKRRTWAKPIRLLIAQEQEQARAFREERQRAELQGEADRQVQTRLDAINARTEEGIGSKRTRTNALNISVVASKLVVVADKIVAEINRRVDTGVINLPLDELRRLVLTASTMIQRAGQVMITALQIERIVLGEPIAVLGIKTEHMGMEQILEHLTSVRDTIERGAKVKQQAEHDALDDKSEVKVHAQPVGANKTN